MQAPTPLPDDDIPYRPSSWRKRALLLLLAVATAVTIVVTLLDPLGGIKRQARPAPPEPNRCAAGQTLDCLGGMATVIVAPAAAAASTPKPAASLSSR